MNESNSSPICISISASFTAEPLKPILLFWGGELEAQFGIQFAPYNQPVQTLLDPNSVFGTNARGVNVLLVRAADLGDSAPYLMEVLELAVGRLPSPSIFCSGDDELLARASAVRGLHVLSYREIRDLYPVTRMFDEQAERLGGIPYTEEFFAAMGTALARRIASLSLPPYKVIAVDCDNTLWEGICGEDGPSGVRLDPGRRQLQEFLAAQRAAGMVLCLASKNNEADVIETFQRHPQMPLRWEHFAATRVNWEPKPGNVASMAAELGLGLDSFLFLDDSLKECAEMDEASPEVLALTLPPDPDAIPHYLKHIWAFDHPVITKADRQRADSYTQAQAFGRAFHAAHSMEDFMASLELTVTIEPVTAETLARVAQLTQRTNQFNFTGQRLSEAEIQNAPEWLTVRVSDRFGDYGLVGAMFLDAGSADLRVNGFLLSCRALGRGVEHRMLRHAGELALSRGLPWITVVFRDTDRNRPAKLFLDSIGASLHFPAEVLAALRWRPAQSPIPSARAASTVAAQRRSVPFDRIARTLSSTQQILAAMRSGAGAGDASMNATERALAVIWSELLKKPSVQLDDRFFDMGGHSLLAVLLLSRIRESFGVELAMDDVYNGALTLRHLAERVEMARLSSVTPDEYEAMLAEIEGLSDEEVRALLEA